MNNPVRYCSLWQDIITRIGVSRSRTQQRFISQDEPYFKEIPHSTGCAERGSILWKRTWEPREAVITKEWLHRLHTSGWGKKSPQWCGMIHVFQAMTAHQGWTGNNFFHKLSKEELGCGRKKKNCSHQVTGLKTNKREFFAFFGFFFLHATIKGCCRCSLHTFKKKNPKNTTTHNTTAGYQVQRQKQRYHPVFRRSLATTLQDGS